MAVKQIELLYFEDLSPFQEAVFAFPIMGKISMRQMTIIGLVSTISWMVYQSSESYLSAIPLLIGGYIGLKKFNVKPPEVQMASIIRFIMFGNRGEKTHREGQAQSKRLGISELFSHKSQSVGKEIKVREIFANPLRPIRLQLRLETPRKEPISNAPTRVEFDGSVVSTVSTNKNGEIEVIIVPQTIGPKKLVVFVEGHQIPVIEEILNIQSLA